MCLCVQLGGNKGERGTVFLMVSYKSYILQITQSTFTCTPPILQITQSTFSSGSSRHGNAHRAPVDWNWVNLVRWTQYKTVQDNTRQCNKQSDGKGGTVDEKYQQYLSLPSVQGTLQQQKLELKLKSFFFLFGATL